MEGYRNIDDIKSQVQILIHENKHREVTPETKHKLSGIYMIYVDHFTSEKIVPFYIGKSKDIQRRYKDHFTELLALNRLSYDEYYKYFFSRSMSFYDGKFKTPKLFKYMIDNDCTLQNYHMVILEEVDEERLNEKEQAYFQDLLPSFFGFNQLDSLLKSVQLQFSKSQIIKTDVEDYLSVLQEDIKGIKLYYNYGFTKFNFEHSMPKDVTFLLHITSDIQSNINEVQSSLNELGEQYISNYEAIHSLYENKKRLHEIYETAYREYGESIEVLKRSVTDKLTELEIYNDDAINYFIYSIRNKNDPQYKKLFKKYLKSHKCKLDFYKLFEEHIEKVNEQLKEKDIKRVPYEEALESYSIKEDRMRAERYKLIFPSSPFCSFPLKYRSNNHSTKINKERALPNTCHIQICISNNAINRSLEYRKEPFIIRFDYCYIDNEGNRTEKIQYIDNETTRNCQLGLMYIEKDYYDMWAFRKERFKISSIMNDVIDNSFISVLSEYKHGINDAVIKTQQLAQLTDVLEEIYQLTDDGTGYTIATSESYRCLGICMMNEGLEKDPWVEQLITKKLPNAKKKRKTSKKAEKKPKEDKKVSREEVFKQKVIKRSDNAISVLKYVSSREKVAAQCNNCGHEWKIRSDHLLTRPYCPLCKRRRKG